MTEPTASMTEADTKFSEGMSSRPCRRALAGWVVLTEGIEVQGVIHALAVGLRHLLEQASLAFSLGAASIVGRSGQCGRVCG